MECDFKIIKGFVLWKEPISLVELSVPEIMVSWKGCQQNKEEGLSTDAEQREGNV